MFLKEIPRWQALAQKSKTIKYIVSHTSYRRTPGSWESGEDYAIFVERRTKLQDRRVGLNHKHGRKKQIGDIMKFHRLNYKQTYELLNDYFGKHIGEG